jgi:hypothetical protein
MFGNLGAFVHGHVMPGQAATVAERLDAMARAAVATVPPALVPLRSFRCARGISRDDPPLIGCVVKSQGL